MNLIDAAIKDLELIADCRTCGNRTPFCDSNPDSCGGYKWRGAAPGSVKEENPPLTLEELREMDGEPVWVEFDPDAGGEKLTMWALLEMNDTIMLTNNLGGRSELLDDMTIEGWYVKAYRRKPEEGTV